MYLRVISCPNYNKGGLLSIFRRNTLWKFSFWRSSHVAVKHDFWYLMIYLPKWFCLFDLILYVPVNNFSVMSGRVFVCWTSTKLGLTCLAPGHNAVTPVRLEPATPLSGVKHSTTEPLRSRSQNEHFEYGYLTALVAFFFILYLAKGNVLYWAFRVQLLAT